MVDPRQLAEQETRAEAHLHVLGWETRRVGPEWVQADRGQHSFADESYVVLLRRIRRKF